MDLALFLQGFVLFFITPESHPQVSDDRSTDDAPIITNGCLRHPHLPNKVEHKQDAGDAHGGRDCFHRTHTHPGLFDIESIGKQCYQSQQQ